MKYLVFALVLTLTSGALAETRSVFVEDLSGERIEVAAIDVTDNGTYTLTMNEGPFTDHFLSMRPFKCLEGPKKH